MKDTKSLVTLLIIIILLSIAAGSVAGFFVYRDYKENSAYLSRRVQSTMDKFGDLESNLKDLYVTLENTMDEGEIERKKVLSKIESIKEDVLGWESGYRAAILQLKAEIDNLKVGKLTRTVENLQDDVKSFKMKIQDLELKLDDARGNIESNKGNFKGVDLGRISVKGKKKPKK